MFSSSLPPKKHANYISVHLGCQETPTVAMLFACHKCLLNIIFLVVIITNCSVQRFIQGDKQLSTAVDIVVYNYMFFLCVKLFSLFYNTTVFDSVAPSAGQAPRFYLCIRRLFFIFHRLSWNNVLFSSMKRGDSSCVTSPSIPIIPDFFRHIPE